MSGPKYRRMKKPQRHLLLDRRETSGCSGSPERAEKIWIDVSSDNYPISVVAALLSLGMSMTWV